MEETTQSTSKRPGFLTALCILTFIGSGLGLLFMLLATVGMGTLLSSVPGMDAAMGGGTAYFAVSAVLAAASLFGAIQMWKLQKMGFFIYAAANVVAIVLPLAFGMPFTAMAAIFPVLFIVLYFLNLKHLK